MSTKVPSEVTFHQLLVNNDKILISCELSSTHTKNLILILDNGCTEVSG